MENELNNFVVGCSYSRKYAEAETAQRNILGVRITHVDVAITNLIMEYFCFYNKVEH